MAKFELNDTDKATLAATIERKRHSKMVKATRASGAIRSREVAKRKKEEERRKENEKLKKIKLAEKAKLKEEMVKQKLKEKLKKTIQLKEKRKLEKEKELAKQKKIRLKQRNADGLIREKINVQSELLTKILKKRTHYLSRPEYNKEKTSEKLMSECFLVFIGYTKIENKQYPVYLYDTHPRWYNNINKNILSKYGKLPYLNLLIDFDNKYKNEVFRYDELVDIIKDYKFFEKGMILNEIDININSINSRFECEIYYDKKKIYEFQVKNFTSVQNKLEQITSKLNIFNFNMFNSQISNNGIVYLFDRLGNQHRSFPAYIIQNQEFPWLCDFSPYTKYKEDENYDLYLEEYNNWFENYIKYTSTFLVEQDERMIKKVLDGINIYKENKIIQGGIILNQEGIEWIYNYKNSKRIEFFNTNKELILNY